MGTITNLDLNDPRFSAINATTRNPATTSSKYQFVSTKDTLSLLSDYGFRPVMAMQAKVKNPIKEGFQRHAIQLENDALSNLLPGVAKPQLLMRHAHDGGSSLQMLLALHVFVCSNGAVRHSGDLGDIRISHSKLSTAMLEQHLKQFVERAPLIVQDFERWNRIRIQDGEAPRFAREAIELRFSEPNRTWSLAPTEGQERYPVLPEAVLEPRRYEQRENTLWNVFNRVQEALVDKGGVKTSTKSKRGNPLTLRPIRGIDANVKLNQGIWQLADQYSQQAA